MKKKNKERKIRKDAKLRYKRKQEKRLRNVRKRKYKKQSKFKERKISKRRIVQQEKKQAFIHRYSIGFYNAKYDKTFRAEIYVTTPKNEKQMIAILKHSLDRWMESHNAGFQAMYKRSKYMGLESEYVGSNDVGRSQIGRVLYSID